MNEDPSKKIIIWTNLHFSIERRQAGKSTLFIRTSKIKVSHAGRQSCLQGREISESGILI